MFVANSNLNGYVVVLIDDWIANLFSLELETAQFVIDKLMLDWYLLALVSVSARRVHDYGARAILGIIPASLVLAVQVIVFQLKLIELGNTIEYVVLALLVLVCGIRRGVPFINEHGFAPQGTAYRRTYSDEEYRFPEGYEGYNNLTREQFEFLQLFTHFRGLFKTEGERVRYDHAYQEFYLKEKGFFDPDKFLEVDYFYPFFAFYLQKEYEHTFTNANSSNSSYGSSSSSNSSSSNSWSYGSSKSSGSSYGSNNSSYGSSSNGSSYSSYGGSSSKGSSYNSSSSGSYNSGSSKSSYNSSSSSNGSYNSGSSKGSYNSGSNGSYNSGSSKSSYNSSSSSNGSYNSGSSKSSYNSNSSGGYNSGSSNSGGYQYRNANQEPFESRLERAYRTLELDQGASLKDAERKYKKFMHKYHPDKLNNNPNMTDVEKKKFSEKTIEINEAIATIRKHFNGM